VVIVLVAGVVDDARVQWQLHATRDELATTVAMMSRTTATMSSDASSARAADMRRQLSARRLGQVTAEIAAARSMLAEAQSGVASGTIEIGDVHACAGGVERSVSALQAGDQSQAVATLSSVVPACENAIDSGSGGPVYPFDFADPDILVNQGTYFAYGTNSTAGNIQIMESPDLVHWTKVGDALPTLASWATPGDTWAPAVIHLKRAYVLYYTAAMAGSKVQCLSVATSHRPQGPFTDSTTAPLECQPSLGGSIDPSPYVDADGQPYLTWKSIGSDGHPATIWAQALDPQGTALVGTTPTALLSPTQSWEGSVVEAPTMVAADGSYFLFYSANNWNSADYAVGVARCGGVLGPCVKPLSGPLLASGPDYEGPGGEAVFTNDAGGLEMAFQGWMPGAVGYPHMRLLFVRPLAITNGVPRVEAG
jgi:Glycosyl hydrolases family 43